MKVEILRAEITRMDRHKDTYGIEITIFVDGKATRVIGEIYGKPTDISIEYRSPDPINPPISFELSKVS